MARRRASYDDLRNLPEHMVGEILDGELVVTPRPAVPHANASSVLGGEIMGPYHRSAGGPGGPGGWWILDEPELHCHADVVVPDLAGWRRERMASPPKTAAIELTPDWVCEVVSPSTVQHDRGHKMRIYAREGVGDLWLVDPLAKTLEVFILDSGLWKLRVVHIEAEKVHVPPFDAVELDLARWWLPD
jgi:Uma2 family endonuclease